jgi:hypothetical protein
MTISIELLAEPLGTPVRHMEKYAAAMVDTATPEQIAAYIYKIAEDYPLHVMTWEIEKRGKVIGGTFRGDSETDSLAALESDIAALMED